MPLTADTYTQLSASDIYDNLAVELRTQFGDDVDLTDGSLLDSLLISLSETLAANQEQSLKDVYEAGYLETAEGDHLDKLVSLIGLTRRSATKATGYVEFSSDNPVDSDYTIQKGTTVQTSGDDPVKYGTTASANLIYIDGFESGALDAAYTGDTASFSVVDGSGVGDPTPVEGTYELECAATSGVAIERDDIEVAKGDTVHARCYPVAGAIQATQFITTDSSNCYQVVLDTSVDEVRLESLSGGSATPLDSGSVTIPHEYLYVTVDTDVDDEIIVTVEDANEAELVVLSATDDTYTSGGIGFSSEDATAAKYWDDVSTSTTAVNIESQSTGTVGNVGPKTVTVMPSPPTGVNSVTNPEAVGNSDLVGVDENPLTTGRVEENDTDLRERASDVTSGGGTATYDALYDTIRNTEGVRSISLYENKTSTDNTGTGGLPPHSFEAVVHGGSDEAIGNAIFDTKAVTARDYGGANGTKASYTVTSSVSGDTYTVDWTRPSTLDVDITISVVHDDTYEGKTALRNRIVDYIGGLDTDSVPKVGTELGEDVYIDQIEEVVQSDDGVIGISSISTTPSITTDGNGLDIVDVGSNEVAKTDGSDGSITVNETKA